MKASSGTQKSSIQFHPEIKITIINWASFSGKRCYKIHRIGFHSSGMWCHVFCKYKYTGNTYCLHLRDTSEVLYTEDGDNTFHWKSCSIAVKLHCITAHKTNINYTLLWRIQISYLFLQFYDLLRNIMWPVRLNSLHSAGFPGNLIVISLLIYGVHGGIVVKALRYKLAGRGFDSRWCHWNFSVT